MAGGVRPALGETVVVAGLARQASEQYFTCSQFFAQFLRHDISRPQQLHSLPGSADLLPLKLMIPLRVWLFGARLPIETANPQ